MSLSVSSLSNAELESLLKEIFADGETMNDRLPSLDQPVDDLAYSLMDTDADHESTLEEKVSILEAQLRKAMCKIDQLADQVIVLQRENETHKIGSCTNCDNVQVPDSDITEQNRLEHDATPDKVDNQSNNSGPDKRDKCRKENRGHCRRKNCIFKHPAVTCQIYSSTGRCNNENQCEHRHPKTVCYAWQSYRECKHGEQCRHRHPVYVRPNPKQNTFLWGIFKSSQVTPDQRTYWGPSPVYHSSQNRGF